MFEQYALSPGAFTCVLLTLIGESSAPKPCAAASTALEARSLRKLALVEERAAG